MKNIRALLSFFICAIAIILVGPNYTAFCGTMNPILSAIRNLEDSGYQLLSWNLGDNNELAMTVGFTEKTFPGRRFYYCISLDSLGNKIEGPIEINLPNWPLEPGRPIFDKNGVCHVYTCRQHGGPLANYYFDPIKGESRFLKFDKPVILGVMGACSVSPEVNIIMAGGALLSKIYAWIIEHDLRSDKLTWHKVKPLTDWVLPHFRTSLYVIDDDHVLIVGQVNFKRNPPTANVRGVSKMIYNLKTEELTDYENYYFDELEARGLTRFTCPGPDQFFKKNDRLYFVAAGNYITGDYDSMILEMDLRGNILLGDTRSSLSIQNSTITNVPRQYLLFLKSVAGGHGEFWMMSLDDFPNLIIDSGK